MKPTDYPFNLIKRIYSDTEHIETTHLKNLYTQINMLTDDQQAVINLRYKQKCTRKECGEALNMTADQSRQLENKVIRMLQHPNRTKHYQAVSKNELDVMTKRHDSLIKENKTLKKILHNVMTESISPSDLITTKETIKTTRIQHEEILSTPIELLDLSTRADNCLRRAGYKTLGDITRTTPKCLTTQRGFGKTIIAEIKNMLEACNLSFHDVETDTSGHRTDEQVGLFTDRWFEYSENEKPLYNKT